MIFDFFVFPLLFVSGVWILAGLVVRGLARNQTFFAFIPAQTFALVSTEKNDPSKSNEEGRFEEGGGSVVDVIHSVPGKKLDRSNSDPMEWKFVDGDERFGLFHKLYGTKRLPLFRYLMRHKIRTLRVGREDKETELHVLNKEPITQFVFFSGDMAVIVAGVETLGGIQLNFTFNILFERVQPIKATLRVANTDATFSLLINEVIANIVGTNPPEAYVGGATLTPGVTYDTKKEKEKLVATINDSDLKDKILQQLGVNTTNVTLWSVTMSEKDRAMLELAATTERENAAKIANAERDKKVRILSNDAEKDYIDRILLPVAGSANATQIRVAEAVAGAYSENETVTTFAPGSDMGLILDPNKREKATK